MLTCNNCNGSLNTSQKNKATQAYGGKKWVAIGLMIYGVNIKKGDIY